LYRLQITGLVDNAVDLDLAQLRALPHHEQITQHFCIQGWSGVAKWGGVSMQTIVDLVGPYPEAKWVVFYSLGEGADKGLYYWVYVVGPAAGALIAVGCAVVLRGRCGSPISRAAGSGVLDRGSPRTRQHTAQQTEGDDLSPPGISSERQDPG